MKADGNMMESVIIPDEQLGIIVTERTPVECLDIPVRALRILKKSGIQFVANLTRTAGSVLYSMEALGWNSFCYIVKALDCNGFFPMRQYRVEQQLSSIFQIAGNNMAKPILNT